MKKDSNMLTFDLKGNTRNRKLGPKDIGKSKFWMKKLNHKAVLRDLNFIEINKDIKSMINISQTDVVRLNQIIQKDSLFLEEHNLMDYSLLLAIESKYRINKKPPSNLRNQIFSNDLSKCYHIGVIDFLQNYNLTKKVERCFKQIIAEDKIKSVAAAPPQLYAKRFRDFIKENVF